MSNKWIYYLLWKYFTVFHNMLSTSFVIWHFVKVKEYNFNYSFFSSTNQCTISYSLKDKYDTDSDLHEWHSHEEIIIIIIVIVVITVSSLKKILW